MALQVKLYVSPDSEIRRFFLDPNADFAAVQQRVNQLTGKDGLRLFWQDNEGDHIVCGSEEEFRAARQSIDNNGLLRLYAKPATTGGARDEKDEKRNHRRITCDGCQGSVIGTRYKCLECPDYDLCEACEHRGMHVDHDMVAIRRPRTCEWKKLFAQGYGSRTGPQCHGPFGGPPGCGPAGPGAFGPGPCGPGPCGPSPCGPGRHGPGRRGPCGPRGFMPPFVRQMMQNLGQTVEMDVDMNRPWPEIIADITKKIQEAVGRTQQQPEGQAKDEQKDQKEQPQQESSPEKHPETENDAFIATATAVAEAVNVVADMINQTFVAPDNGTRTPSEAEGWTHLQAEAPEETTVKPEPEKPVEPPTGNRIEAALKTMEEMGFPNEGNLLRRLLENYNGDISRVLDSIK